MGMSERTDASGAVGVEQVAEETAGAVPGRDKPPSARMGLSSQGPCYLPPDSRFGPCLNPLPAVRVLALQSAILVRGVLHGAMSQACRTPQLNAGGGSLTQPGRWRILGAGQARRRPARTGSPTSRARRLRAGSFFEARRTSVRT